MVVVIVLLLLLANATTTTTTTITTITTSTIRPTTTHALVTVQYKFYVLGLQCIVMCVLPHVIVIDMENKTRGVSAVRMKGKRDKEGSR